MPSAPSVGCAEVYKAIKYSLELIAFRYILKKILIVKSFDCPVLVSKVIKVGKCLLELQFTMYGYAV